MKITSFLAGLALAGGLGAAAPAAAQWRGHGYGHYRHWDRGYHGYRHYGPRRFYRRGFYRPVYGYGYGYGYRHRFNRGRLVCRYRFGERRCFRVY